MIASRIVSFFLFTATVITTGAFASPIADNVDAVQKRQATDASSQTLAILTALQGSTNSILPQISSLSSSGQANSDTLTPLISQLTASFSTASGSLSAVQPESDWQHPQVPHDKIAALIAAILNDVLITLDGVLLFDVPALLVTVDVVVSTLLTDVEFVLAGVLTLVSGLLGTVTLLLSALGFTLISSVLGLVLGL